MRTKKLKIILICIGVFIGVNFLAQLIRNLSVYSITGYDFNSPEYYIAYQLNIQKDPAITFQTVEENSIIFAVSTDSEGKSQSLAIWKKDDGTYTGWTEDYISIGVSLYALGFNGSAQGARLFRTSNGKYVFDFLIEGYPYAENEDPENIVNINNASVYDNYGIELSHIAAENAVYYYSVMDEIPENYKVYLRIEDREFLLLDSSKEFIIPENFYENYS